MNQMVKNKKLYLATKLLAFLDNPPSSIIILDQELDFTSESTKQEAKKNQQAKPYESMSIRAELLSKLFPSLTKKEVNEGLLSLEEQGIIEYKSLEEKITTDYKKIKYFNVKPNKPELKHFITIASSGLFGFNLSDKDTYNEVVTVLKIIQDSNKLNINFSDFHSENVSYILKGIANFSDAISISFKKGTTEIDYDIDEDGIISPVSPSYLPENIVINDKTKITNILAYIEKYVKTIYIQGVDLFIEKNSRFVWRCKSHNHFLKECKTSIDINKWLDTFSRGGYKTCPKCSDRNTFSISPDGEITYSILPKNG